MSPDSERLAAARRREATRAAIRYFLLFFALFLFLGALAAYTVRNARQDEARSLRVRMEYCRELEKLKTQNREDVADDKKHYRRNLRLLGLKDTPELRRAVEANWRKELRRNRAKPCPYRA